MSETRLKVLGPDDPPGVIPVVEGSGRRAVVLGCLPRQVPDKPGEPEADADTDGGELETEGLGGGQTSASIHAVHQRSHCR